MIETSYVDRQAVGKEREESKVISKRRRGKGGIDGVTIYRDRGDCGKSSLGIRNYKFGFRQAVFV